MKYKEYRLLSKRSQSVQNAIDDMININTLIANGKHITLCRSLLSNKKIIFLRNITSVSLLDGRYLKFTLFDASTKEEREFKYTLDCLILLRVLYETA